MMIFSTKPVNFNPKFTIVSCFYENNGKILLLKRNKTKPQGGTWGIPAGKVDRSEELSKAIVRELFEETSVRLKTENLQYFDKVYTRFNDFDFIFHMFFAKNNTDNVIVHPEEHSTFKWVTPQEALKMNLIQDLDACIKKFYKM